jgi:hypothetical protein
VNHRQKDRPDRGGKALIEPDETEIDWCYRRLASDSESRERFLRLRLTARNALLTGATG